MPAFAEIPVFDPSLIESERKRLGISRLRFARELGTTPTSVWQWESGKYRPNADSQHKIVAYFVAFEAALKEAEAAREAEATADVSGAS